MIEVLAYMRAFIKECNELRRKIYKSKNILDIQQDVSIVIFLKK